MVVIPVCHPYIRSGIHAGVHFASKPDDSSFGAEKDTFWPPWHVWFHDRDDWATSRGQIAKHWPSRSLDFWLFRLNTRSWLSIYRWYQPLGSQHNFAVVKWWSQTVGDCYCPAICWYSIWNHTCLLIQHMESRILLLNALLITRWFGATSSYPKKKLMKVYMRAFKNMMACQKPEPLPETQMSESEIE